jgi:hypothetical protein
MIEIIMDISPNGQNVKFEVKGAQGKVCTEITKALEEASGSLVKRVLKSEYHKEIEIAQTVKIGK